MKKKSTSEKEPGISQVLHRLYLICLYCCLAFSTAGLGNLLLAPLASLTISKWCLFSLHSLLQIAACGRRYLQYSFFYPQSTSHMFEMGKSGAVASILTHLQLVKGISCAEAKLLLWMIFSPLDCQEELPLVDAAYLISWLCSQVFVGHS